MSLSTPSTTDTTPANNRRTRTTRACDTCRQKKIKCDVDPAKPCTACQQYGWECTFNDAAKKRGPPKGYIESLEARLKKMEHLLQEMQNRKRKRPADDGPLAIKNILTYEQDPKDKLPKATMDFLVFKYFDIPQETLPIIDRNDFLHGYRNQSAPNSLVYAVCAYTCYRLENNDPIFRNTRLREETFRYAFNKAIEMIKEEYLMSRMTTLQAIVVVCSHPVFLIHSNQNWALIGMAVRMAQELGFHRVLIMKTLPSSPETVELYKRLWCSIYVMERWNAAIMSRPLAIEDSDCDTDLQTTVRSDNVDYTGFINLISLSRILGDVNRQIYLPYERHQTLSAAVMDPVVRRLQARLDSWWEALPADYRVHDERINPAKGVCAALLPLYHHGVTLMLHRPFIDTKQEALSKCTEVAKHVTNLARSIPKRDALHLSFHFVCYSVYQALVIHWYNSYHNNSSVVAAAAQEYARISVDECLLGLCDTLLAGEKFKAVMKAAAVEAESKARSKEVLAAIGPPFLELSDSVLDYLPTWAQPP